MNITNFAKKNNVQIIDKGNGHIQLKGKLLVNYYPESKFKTAYISGMKNSRKNVSFKDAVLMAVQIPMVKGIKEKRKNNYKGSKNILLKNNPYCHWCNVFLTKETATLDHVIPLAKGGLNNMNNYVLACEPCNQKRGSDMPELKRKENE